MSTATPGSRIVLDASAALRAGVDGNSQASHWFTAVERGEVEATWPDIALVEIANGLLRLVRGRMLAEPEALRVTARFLSAPVRSEPLAPLTLPAFHLAAERGLSVYDAAYVVLAESRDARLVTADRRLASATANSILIGG